MVIPPPEGSGAIWRPADPGPDHVGGAERQAAHALGAFLAGILLLSEALTPLRLAAAALIASGLVLMKLSSAH
ncbi:hypothetical protein [Mangrovicoccus ximenensis]|uniref:hypothetical protein n=1 Tax=Mangrovicoccus ximenensis TaxID=1911570 RepID=UPI00191BE410|nr:hypothetical protein [Mangrovicoccus ximenensis]